MNLRRSSFALGAGIALCSAGAMQAQTEIRLWPGEAPGSEDWSIPESVTVSPSGDRVITNVSDPTLTVFLPEAGLATGAAAVIAPGGALRVLGFDNLRVIDGSIMPDVPRANTNLTCMTIAEHMAARLRR